MIEKILEWVGAALFIGAIVCGVVLFPAALEAGHNFLAFLFVLPAMIIGGTWMVHVGREVVRHWKEEAKEDKNENND